VIDVRGPDEWEGSLGHLAFAERVELDELARAATMWDPHDPIVLVDRSGRRSARGTRVLEDLGFHHVASLTGGMMDWNLRGWPVVDRHRDRRGGEPDAPRETVGVEHRDGPLTPEEVEEHVGARSHHRWVKMAGLMLFGTQSCVDGRDAHGVVGTPGGDAGELLLILSGLEEAEGRPLTDEEVGALLDTHLDAFGRFYMHTDEHALETLGASLAADATFGEVEGLDTVQGVEALLRHPPHALEEPLLTHLAQPRHVGCGHLRLVLSEPEEYAVRRGLTQSLLRAVHRRIWRGDPIDYVVLEGSHEEGAVVRVRVEGPLHAYSWVPTLTPRAASGGVGHELFVYHPEVSAYLRRESARHFLEESAFRGEAEAFLDALDARAHDQLLATVRHLAARLPVFDARFERGGAVTVAVPEGPL
jgi:rhodanese-related sulfurtransferase